MQSLDLAAEDRAELEAKVLAAAFKQSFEAGDSDGAGLAHTHLCAILQAREAATKANEFGQTERSKQISATIDRLHRAAVTRAECVLVVFRYSDKEQQAKNESQSTAAGESSADAQSTQALPPFAKPASLDLGPRVESGMPTEGYSTESLRETQPLKAVSPETLQQLQNQYPQEKPDAGDLQFGDVDAGATSEYPAYFDLDEPLTGGSLESDHESLESTGPNFAEQAAEAGAGDDITDEEAAPSPEEKPESEDQSTPPPPGQLDDGDADDADNEEEPQTSFGAPDGPALSAEDAEPIVSPLFEEDAEHLQMTAQSVPMLRMEDVLRASGAADKEAESAEPEPAQSTEVAARPLEPAPVSPLIDFELPPAPEPVAEPVAEPVTEPVAEPVQTPSIPLAPISIKIPKPPEPRVPTEQTSAADATPAEPAAAESWTPGSEWGPAPEWPDLENLPAAKTPDEPAAIEAQEEPELALPPMEPGAGPLSYLDFGDTDSDTTAAEPVKPALPPNVTPIEFKVPVVVPEIAPPVKTASGATVVPEIAPPVAKEVPPEAQPAAANFYEALGVGDTSTYEVIHTSFLRKLRNHIRAHQALPTESVSRGEIKIFKEHLRLLCIAHDVLKDPVTRTDYDLRRLGLRQLDGPDGGGRLGNGKRTALKIGELLECADIIQPTELQVALDMHKAEPQMPFGQFLLTAGFLSEEELDSAILGQKLITFGKITVAQFQTAISLQRKEKVPFFDTLVGEGWLTPADIFDDSSELFGGPGLPDRNSVASAPPPPPAPEPEPVPQIVMPEIKPVAQPQSNELDPVAFNIQMSWEEAIDAMTGDETPPATDTASGADESQRSNDTQRGNGKTDNPARQSKQGMKKPN